MNILSIPAPNYTQTPNIVYDEIAKTLKEGELRVLLVIMRQTFGWQKKWDRISMTQLQIKTGMCRDAVNNSLKSLIEKGILNKKKEGPNGQQKCWYSLVVQFVENDEEYPDDESDFIEDSNNSYQSSKETPPSRFRRPTKETITKKRKETTTGPKAPKEKKAQKKAPPASGDAKASVVVFFKNNKFSKNLQAQLRKKHGVDKIHKAIVYCQSQEDEIHNVAGWLKRCLDEEWELAKKGPKSSEDRVKEVQQYIQTHPQKEAILRGKKAFQLDWSSEWIELKGVRDGYVDFKEKHSLQRVKYLLDKLLRSMN